MDHSHSATRSARTVRLAISALLAFLLLAGLMPFSTGAPPQAAADEIPGAVNVLLHFKDSNQETVDFAQYEASAVRADDTLLVAVGDGSAALDYRDNLRFAVYDRYAAFNDQQRDITDECRYDGEAGVVNIPAAYAERLDALAIVFWLSPAHAAYDRFITSQLITDDVLLDHNGQQTVLASDVAQLKAAVESPANTLGVEGAPLARSVPFPGQPDAHYQLNPYTRLEEFDRDQTEKQIAYGYTGHWVGSYCFGAMFGTHREFSHGVSSETDWNAPVLDTAHNSYDEVVEAYLSDTIAARLGEDARFATSMGGKNYRDRCITLGTTYKDDGYLPGTSPDHKAIARGGCGSSDINNGAGTPLPQPNGNNYITFKGIYNGSQTKYTGWYTFFYKFDTKSGATGNTFQDIVGYLLAAPPRGGNVQLTKVSSDPSISNANGNYSLEHGVFAAFDSEQAAASARDLAQARTWKTWQEAQSWAGANALVTLVTEKDGTTPVVRDVEAGDYFVAELFAPPGFRLSDRIQSATVEVAESDDDICAIRFEDEPQSGSIDLLKVSNNPDLTAGNDCYTLAGATYGIFADAACLQPVRSITTALDEQGDGYARADKLPIGSYWVKETARPHSGFALDPRVYPVVVTDQVVTRVNTTSVTDKAKLNPLAIVLQKKDDQTLEAAPQGNATLGDAHFRINYYDVPQATAETVRDREPRASWLVRTDDTGSFRLDCADGTFTHVDKNGTESVLPYKISGPDFYRLSDGRAALPLGTYTIQEVKAPEGYLLDDTVHVRHVTDANHDDEVVETFNAEQDGDLVTDRVARADLAFLKRADGAAKLAGIPFKLTSKTTGEWHIIVTDKNGMASTQATAAHPHDARTNANDEQFRAEDGSFQMPLVLDEEALDATAGTWFGLTADGNAVPADNARGALPFDTYELEELRCPGNELFQMIRDEVVIDETDDCQVIDLGTLNNTAAGKPTLRTSAYDGTTQDVYDTEISAVPGAAVVDRVTYTGLTPHTPYTVEGALMDKTTGEPFLVGGEAVTATVEFTPDDYTGYVNVPFSFDASAIGERTELVVFETLLQHDAEVARHHDLDDRKQTITVNPVSIGTTAVDSASGTHEGLPADEATIIDTVSFQGLMPGREYRLVALLMNKATGEPYTVDDRVVTVEHVFTPEASEGTVPVEIAIPGGAADGTSFVVFESLYYEDRELAVHADINDEGQTVSYGYPDLPLPPTGGAEEAPAPATRLAQTGDEAMGTALALGAMLLASLGVGAWSLYRKRHLRK